MYKDKLLITKNKNWNIYSQKYKTIYPSATAPLVCIIDYIKNIDNIISDEPITVDENGQVYKVVVKLDIKDFIELRLSANYHELVIARELELLFTKDELNKFFKVNKKLERKLLGYKNE